jgi:hypothetical protein
MTLGVADKQGDLLDAVTRFCDETLDKQSIYAFLHREREQLFPDEAFADLFDQKGRRSVPPSVVAVVMVLQRLEGLSDREAAERYCFDNRWRYAAGVGGYDGAGWTVFAHTVLVDMRERLRHSEHPNRIFDAARDAAKEAGLIGRKRVLDSTPLYDAVATMDTVTLIRSAIRGLLKAAEAELAAELRAALSSGDDYASSAKPQVDWDDAAAREALIDSRAKDGYACLLVLEGRALDPVVAQAADLLATVVGQDIEVGDDGVFRIARKVAKDRVISTVDPETRHGRKTQAKGFDGYKGHAAIDPDSEIITETVVTPGNAGDASVAEDLIADLLADDESDDTSNAEGSDDLVGGGKAKPKGPHNGLRRQRLWDRAVPRATPRRGDRVEVQDPDPERSRWPIHQGPLRCRFGCRHRHVSQRRHCGDRPSVERRWHGLLQGCLCHLRAAPRVHHGHRRAHHRHQRARRGTRPRSAPTKRSRLA